MLVLLGIAGLLFPAIPGAPLLWAGLATAAWAEDFEFVHPVTLGILGVLAVLTYVVDFLAGAFGARRFGASGRAMAGAMIGAAGGIFLGLAGVLIGPFVGAVIGELSVARNLQSAGRAGFGATVGLALGVAAKLGLAFTMIALYLFARFF